jgi:hypothetical protein
MLFINTQDQDEKGDGGVGTRGADDAGAIEKKRSEGVIAIPRRAPYQAREAVCQDRSFSDCRILPDFRVESPVYAAAAPRVLPKTLRFGHGGAEKYA